MRITKACTTYNLRDNPPEIWVRQNHPNEQKKESLLCVLRTYSETLNVVFAEDITIFIKGEFAFGPPEVHLTGYIEIYDPKDII